MTHFGLGSSGEDPGGTYWGVRCKIAFPGTSTVCLGGSAIPLGSLEDPLPGWLPSALTDCLTVGEVVTCLGRAFPSRDMSGGLTACLGGSGDTREGGNYLTACLGSLTACLRCCWTASFPQGEGEHLPACLTEWPVLLSCFLPQGEGDHLPEINCLLPQGEGEHLPACLLGKLSLGKS